MAWWGREAQPRPPKTRHCGRVPLRHATTSSPEEAAALYAQHALVLNVPLNHGPGHRFFEVMAAGVPQPERLRAIPVAPPPYLELKDLLKGGFGAVGGADRGAGGLVAGGLGVFFWAALGERPEIGALRHQMWCGADGGVFGGVRRRWEGAGSGAGSSELVACARARKNGS